MFSRFFLRKRLSDLEDEVAKLARVVGDRDLDWADMRARCKRLLDRTEKAAARADKGEEAISSVDTQPDPLTPAQRRIQDLVNHRRKLQGIREAS